VVDFLYILGIIAFFALVVGSLRMLMQLVGNRQENPAGTSEPEVSPDHRVPG